MDNWLEDFKKKTQLEHQTLYRFYTREYESLDEVLYDLNDYLQIAYGGKRFEEQKELFINRISSIIYAASKITRYDGSLEEAFPYEGSYCVTALIAYDTLVTIDLLTPELSTVETNGWLNIVESWINFLIKSDEEHALISNHLATAAAALFRWAHIADGRNSQNLARQKGELLLKRILFIKNFLILINIFILFIKNFSNFS